MAIWALPNFNINFNHKPSLTPWSRVILEKLTGSQPVKKLPAIYEIRRFITAFTSARHLSLSWARSIQSIPPFHFLKIHFNINLPSTSRFSKWSFHSGFPTKTLYAAHLSPIRATWPALLIILYSTARITLGEEYRPQMTASRTIKQHDDYFVHSWKLFLADGKTNRRVEFNGRILRLVTNTLQSGQA
jgi:hypothetical protein